MAGTDRQYKSLGLYAIEENDYSPSFAEIAKYMEWKSRSSSKQMVDALVYLKKIKIDPKKKRSLELV